MEIFGDHFRILRFGLVAPAPPRPAMAVVRWPLLLISVLADSSSFNSFVERHGGSYGYGMENFEAFVESNMTKSYHL